MPKTTTFGDGNTKISITWNGDDMMDNTEEEVMLAVKKSALDLKRRSSNDAPIDLGDLRGNASAAYEQEVIAQPRRQSSAGAGPAVEPPGKKLTARVGFTLPYALIQHENLQFNHPKGGKAKYLEDPANQMRKKYESFIGKAIRKGINK